MTGAPTFDPGPGRAAWAAAPDPVTSAVVVPVGAVEQHGPHLPVGVDVWLAHAVALGAARETGAAVAEPLAYGCSSHHLAFGRTVSLRAETLIALVCDVCGSLAGDGATVLLLNGHGGNRGALQVALAELGERGVRDVAAVSYFDLIRDDLPQLDDDQVGHACALETSLILHLWPDAVRTEAIPDTPTPPSWPDPHLWAAPGVSRWHPFDEIDGRGVIGDPAAATAALGEAAYTAAVSRCADVLRRLSAGEGR